jgi:hypothetical protein
VPSIYIEGLTLDDTNRRKMAIHGVTGKEAMEAASDPEAKAFRNHSPEAAPWVLVGRTRQGRYVTLPLDETPEMGVWRPRTGYDSSNKELRRFKNE